jgi:hypothetical protein
MKSKIKTFDVAIGKVDDVLAPKILDMPKKQIVKDLLNDNESVNIYASPTVKSFSTALPPEPLSENDILPISRVDVERLDINYSDKVLEISKKLTGGVVLRNFDAIGDILAETELVMGNIISNSGGKGISNWLKNRVFGARKLFVKQIHTVDSSLNLIQEKINSNIAKHEQWIKDCEEIFKENYSLYYTLINIINTYKDWIEKCNNTLQSLPPIDPDTIDAPMRAQRILDAKAFVRRLEQSMDYVTRMKVVIETNIPTIRNQQESSAKTIQTSKDILMSFPIIQNQLTTYLHSLDIKSTNAANNQGKKLINSTILIASNSAKEATLEANKNANEAIIETNTITTIMQNGLDLLKDIKKIESESDALRKRDMAVITDARKIYLETVTKQ